MQGQFTEKLVELCNSTTKPLREITDLNINTVSELAKNIKFEELPKFNKPEDIVAVSAKIANESFKAAGNYTQKVLDIWRDAATESGKILNEIIRESINKTPFNADIFRQTANKVAERATGKHRDKDRE